MTDYYHHTALCIRHAMTLCLTARGQASTFLLKGVIHSAPRNEAETTNSQWRARSLCWKMLVEGNVKRLHGWAQEDFDACSMFWLQLFPFLPADVQSGICERIDQADDLFGTGTRPSDHPAVRQVLDPPPADARQILLFPGQPPKQ